MHRINDDYKWKTLNHWRTAIEKGNVQPKRVEKEGCNDALLRAALRLLEDDCFPIAIICCLGKDGQKEVWMTSLWADIFDFFNGRKGIKTEAGEIWFTEMSDIEQDKFLSANIASIWVAS